MTVIGNQHSSEVRRIQTIEDVAAVLDSPFASFTELMDCVSIAQAVGDWSLRHRAAERSFREAKLETPRSAANLAIAASIVIDNYFKLASSLDDLARVVGDADSWLRHNRSKLDSAGASDSANEQTQLLAEVQVLLATDEPQAKVRLCARLRKLERSDLGVEVVRPVANRHRDNAAALTTLGAAYCDTGEFQKSERALRAALEVSPDDNRARVALSRTLQDGGRQNEALDVARVAFASETNTYTAHRLVSAAVAVGDDVAIEQAVAEISNAAESESGGSPDVYLLLLAAEALAKEGRVDDMVRIVDRLDDSEVSINRSTAKRVARLRRLQSVS